MRRMRFRQPSAKAIECLRECNVVGIVGVSDHEPLQHQVGAELNAKLQCKKDH